MTQKTGLGRIPANYPIYLLMTIVIFLYLIGFFMQPSIPAITELRNTLNAALPFAAIVGIIILCRVYYQTAKRKETRWYMSFFFFFTVILTFAVWIATGHYTTPLYVWLYSLFDRVGGGATQGILAFGYMSIHWYRYSARDPMSIMLVVGTILAIICIIPIGSMIFPPITTIGLWVLRYPILAGGSVFDFVKFTATAAVLARIVLAKERLRGG